MSTTWGGVTWNRWAVGLKARGNWQTKHGYLPAQVWNLMEVRAEVRHYWRTRQISEQFPANTSKLKKLISCRRPTLKHPNTTYYRGFYLSYSKYSFLLTGTGRQGKAVNAGFLYGIVSPLYQFANGNTLDFDLGVSIGLTYTQYDEYRHDRESNCYERLSADNRQLVPLPLPHELRVGLTYRFTNDMKHHLPQRYRWRYDVDEVFRDKVIARVKREKEIADSIQKVNKNIGTLQDYFDLIYNRHYNRILNQLQSEKPTEPTVPEKKEAKNAKKEKATKPKAEKTKKKGGKDEKK